MQISVTTAPLLKCLLKIGQRVDFNTPYLEKKTATAAQIPVAKKLGISPTHIFRYLKKFVGETIKKGEVLAIKKSLIASTKVVSEQAGVIAEIDHQEGTVTISSIKEKTDSITAFFKGEVLAIKKEEILLQVEKGESFSIKTATWDFGGETFYLPSLSSTLSTSQLANKILVSDTLSSYLQSKVEALGALGFVLLTKPTQPSDFPFAQIKNIDDFKKIKELHFPYCLISKTRSTIYFYQV
jgi:hypothetical protein